MTENGSIGFFDSGLGGLTVVKEVMRLLPGENILYFGDNGRSPYGEYSREILQTLSLQISGFLLKRRAKMIVVACNTATAASLDLLQSTFSIPVIGVIEPGSRAAVRATKNGRIGLLATNYTVNSGFYQKEITDLLPEAEVFSEPGPEFTPLIESGKIEDSETEEAVLRHLKPLKDKDIDTLLLGCTIFPIINPLFIKHLDKKVSIIDPSMETAISVREILLEYGLVNEGETSPRREFYTTGDPDRFKGFGDRFLPGAPIQVSNVDPYTLVPSLNI